MVLDNCPRGKLPPTLKLTLTQTLTCTGRQFSKLSGYEHIISKGNILSEMFWTTLPFEALSWYIHHIFWHLCCLLLTKSSTSLHFFVCMLTDPFVEVFIEECRFFPWSLSIFCWSLNSTGSSPFVLLGSSGGHS